MRAELPDFSTLTETNPSGLPGAVAAGSVPVDYWIKGLVSLAGNCTS